MHRSLRPFVSCLVFLLPASARGQEAEAPLPVRVEVLGPSSCPSADDFVRTLDQHLRVRPARADEPAHALVIQIAQREDSFAGRLDSPSTAGVESREIAGSSCHEVIAALALSAALSLEGKPPPDQNVGERAGMEPLIEREESAKEDSVHQNGSRAERSAAGPREAEREKPSKAQKSTRRGTPWLGLGARTWGVSLQLLAGPEISTGFRSASREWEGSLQLGVLFELVQASPHLSITAPYAGFSLCWMPLHASDALDAGVCATTDVAIMHGKGISLVDAGSANLGYGASGASGRLRWHLADRMFVLADAGAQGVWLAPEWRAIAPERTLQQAGRLNVSAGVGVGWIF